MTDPVYSASLNLLTPEMIEPGEVPLSPDSLMIYLQTRLGDLDAQIETLMGKQTKAIKVREKLDKIQAALARLKQDPDKPASARDDKVVDGTDNAKHQVQINKALDELAQLEPDLAESMRAKFKEDGFILDGATAANPYGDVRYTSQEVIATQEYLDSVSRQLESGASLDMIRLQSLMSSRQTAVQLSTNVVSALNESTRSIANNVGK